jgi:hypothetical protein
MNDVTMLRTPQIPEVSRICLVIHTVIEMPTVASRGAGYRETTLNGASLKWEKRIRCSPHLLFPKLNPGMVGLQMSRSSLP